jgi:CRP/FNR family transcriptional regulator, dissimilatory nitrate respiration regulator
MVADPLPVSLEAGSVVRVLEARELLFQQGDRTAAIYKIEIGRIRLIRRTVDDHPVILYTARRGEYFAEASLFAETYHCDAVAAAPSRVRVYPKTAVIAALRADPDLAQAFMARLAVQLQELRTLMELRNIRSAHERVLQYLRWRAIEQGRSIAVEGQLQDIAAEIGITREALYRTLTALETEGHLSKTDAAIILLGKSDGA